MRKFLLAGFASAVLVVALIGGFAFLYNGVTSQAQASSDCTNTTPGVLPGIVPQPFNSIFTAASAQWKIDPALLAAIFMSEHGNSWPPVGSAQATSSAGAMGWFQFEPGTWVGYSSSNPQHPNGDPQDLTDSAYAAAHYLSVLGGSLNMQPGNPGAPQKGTVAWVAGAYNGGTPLVGNSQNDNYRVNAVQKFLEFKGGSGNSSSSVAGQVAPPPQLVGGNPAISNSNPGCASNGNILLSPNGYTSPFPVQPQITRAIDQGVDYHVPVGTPLRAIGNVQVVNVIPFYNGQPSVIFKLLDGSLAGKCAYYAEEVTGYPGISAYDSAATASLKAEVGKSIAAGQAVAYMATSGTNLEFGFADCASGNTLAKTTGGYKENTSTAAGVSFNKFMVALGVPSDSPYPIVTGSVAGMGYP
jgi:murein DD-endopeptidase MepM/ murein hydrolase activator NlpD